MPPNWDTGFTGGDNGGLDARSLSSRGTSAGILFGASVSGTLSRGGGVDGLFAFASIVFRSMGGEGESSRITESLLDCGDDGGCSGDFAPQDCTGSGDTFTKSSP